MNDEHKHDPDCTCGCHDHDHEHEHEHEHMHAHEHEHHHTHTESIELTWANVGFEAHTHDQAATVSMNVYPKDGCAFAFSNLVDIMQAIAQAAESAGGFVGHIKGFARRGDEFAHASVTAADLPPTFEGDQTLSLDTATEIQLVAIVLLISEDDLLAICKNALA